MDIRHIPGKKNPADSLNCQLVSDALVRKSSVTDANASYVQKLRVAENATDNEIRAALHQLFNNGPQGPTRRQDQLTPEGHSILQYPHGTDSVEDASPQGTTTTKAILSSTVISKIQLDPEIKNLLTSTLHREAPYSQILQELEGERGKRF